MQVRHGDRLVPDLPLGVVFSQLPDHSGDFSGYDSDEARGSLCLDDFWGVDQGINGLEFWGFDFCWEGYNYHPGDPTGQAFEITFYADNGGQPGDIVQTYSDLQPQFTQYEDFGYNVTDYHWTVDFYDTISLSRGWVSVQSTYAPDKSTFYWISSSTGNNNAKRDGYDLFDNLAFNLTTHGTLPDHDVRVMSIMQPESGNASVLIPLVKVANIGNASETFPLIFSIASSLLEYNQSVTVTVDSYHSVVVSLPDWTPDDWQQSENIVVNYTASATAFLTDDQNQTDNNQQKQFSLSYPYFHDIILKDLLSPTEDGLGQTLPVKLNIQNIGQYPEWNFTVNCHIDKKQDLLNERFPNDSLPPGWCVDTPKWKMRKSTAAGGSPYYEAAIWTGETLVGSFHLWTTEIDTTGQTNLSLIFKHSVWCYPDHNFTLLVQTTTDGGFTWHTVWTMPSQEIDKERVAIPLSAVDGVGSASFQAAWVFNGSLRYGDSWMIDDIRLQQPQTLTEYDENVTVTDWLQPGHSLQLSFPNWTANNLVTDKTSGAFDYQTTAAHDLPGDENLGNDAAASSFELTYFHDTKIQIISPTPNTGESTNNRDEHSLHFDDGTNQDAIGLTSGGTFESAIRLTPTELGPFDGSPITKIRVHYGYPDGGSGAAINGQVKIYDAGTDTHPGAVLSTEPFTTPTTYSWFNVTLTNLVFIDGSKDLWISTEWQDTQGGQYPAGVDDGPCVLGKGDWISFNGNWMELSTYGYDMNWNLWAYIGYPPPPPRPYWVGQNQTLGCLIRNIGTFTENNQTATATILKESDGSLYYQDSLENISLPPLGSQQNLTFQNCLFSNADDYWLYMNLTPDTDDYPGNNHCPRMYLRSDPYPPVSTVNLPPPDGNNGWYLTSPRIMITAYDNLSGLAALWYSIDGGGWIPYTGPISFTFPDGNHTVGCFAMDYAGNVETPHNISIHIDTNWPYLILNKDILPHKIKFTAVVQDTISLMDRVEFYINQSLRFTQIITDPSGEQTAVWIFIPQNHTAIPIIVKAYDRAGNFALACTWINSLNLPSGQSQPATLKTTLQSR